VALVAVPPLLPKMLLVEVGHNSNNNNSSGIMVWY